MKLLIFSLLYCCSMVCLHGQYNGAIRLVDNGAPSLYHGRLQVYYLDRWGNVCGGTTFGQREADVVCRNLGYLGAKNFTTHNRDNYGVDTSPAIIDDVTCSDSYILLLSCTFQTDINPQCSDDNDIGVSCYTASLWYDPYPGMVRLQGGNYTNEGRVEVYCNGQWGSLCGDTLTNNDATTVCQQLGYSSSPSNLTLDVEDGEIFWFAALNCPLPRQCLTSCTSCPIHSITCPSPNTLQYIYCEYSPTNDKPNVITCDNRNYPRGDGAVKLVGNGSTPTSGRVQIYLNGVWGNICRRSAFTSTNADVICHQLGYIGAVGWSYANIDSFGIDGRIPMMDDVQCFSSNLLVLQQCLYSTIINPLCTDGDDVSVNCSAIKLTDNPYIGMVRLVDGEFVSEGRVEVYCNDQWGTICNHGLTTTDALTICKQLGYNHGVISSLLMPGSALMPVWLSSLSCSSSDNCINQCKTCPSVQNTVCSHDNDVTVQCYFDSSATPFNQNLEDCQSISLGVGYVGSMVLYRNGISSSQFNSGRVVLYYAGQWGNICHKSANTHTGEAADVMCHQLSYSGASSWSTAADDLFGVDTRPSLIKDVSCFTDLYLVIFQCSYSTITSQCTDNDDISIACYTSRLWDNPYSGMIRLVGGNFSNEGRVEVYCNGAWGTVCNGVSTNMEVFCSQLGYTGIAMKYTNSVADNTNPIWLRDPHCTSSDICVADCQGCPSFPSSSCLHSQDVHLACEFNTNTVPATGYGFMDRCSQTSKAVPGVTFTPVSGTVILTRDGVYSKSYTSGRVLVYGIANTSSTGLIWGNICRLPSFHSNASDVICHQLGYTGSSSWSYAAIDSYGNDSRIAIVNRVSCTNSSWITLFHCSMSTIISSSCTDANDVGVSCYTTRIWDNPYNGQIRLTGGRYSNEGLLEIYCNGQWGTVCATNFDLSVASVACHQLGYNGAGQFNHLSIYGISSQPIWFNRFSCTQSATCFTSCQQCPDGSVSSCAHSQDVSISCYNSIPAWYTLSTSCAYPPPEPPNIGAIVGGISGAVVVILIIVLVVLLDKHKKGQLKKCTVPLGEFINKVKNFIKSIPEKCVLFVKKCIPGQSDNQSQQPQSQPDEQQPLAAQPEQQSAQPEQAALSANVTLPDNIRDDEHPSIDLYHELPPPPPYNPGFVPPPASFAISNDDDAKTGKNDPVIGFRMDEPPPYDSSWI